MERVLVQKQVAKRRRPGPKPTDAADYFRFLLRMPEDMADRIAALAKADFSPINSFILRMLRDVLPDYEAAAREQGLLPPRRQREHERV
jgi:hypothetical protein